MASATAFLMCSRYRCKNLCRLTALLFLALRRRSIMWLIKIPLTETDCDDVLHQFLMVIRTVFGGRIFCRAAIAIAHPQIPLGQQTNLFLRIASLDHTRHEILVLLLIGRGRFGIE